MRQVREQFQVYMLYKCYMLITRKQRAPITNLQLKNLLHEKAEKIKSRSFSINISSYNKNSAQYQEQSSSFNETNNSIVNMFTKLTKKIKNQLKQEKEYHEEKVRNKEEVDFNQQVIVGKHLKLNKQIEIINKIKFQSEHGDEKNSQCLMQFRYTDQCFKNKNKVSESRSRYKSKETSRKSTLTNFNQRICKGSTISRLAYDTSTNKKRKSNPKAKTEIQNTHDYEGQFAPLGKIMMNKSSKQLKNEAVYPVPISGQRSQHDQQEPLKQIYNKIFIRYPHRQNIENARIRTSRNMRKLYSSYKMSHERRMEKEQEKQKLRESHDSNDFRKAERDRDNRDNKDNRDRKVDDKSDEKLRQSKSNKQVCVSQKNLYSRIREKQQDAVAESGHLGSMLGPWGTEKI